MHVVVWLVVLSAIFGFGWYKSWENQVAWGAEARWRNERDEFMQHHRVLAQFLLAAALSCGMAWLVHPFYPITPGGIFSNDKLFFGAMMLVISVYLLAVTLSVYSQVESPITRLRFRLRDLLIAITACAILLAAGPFGYVTMLVAVAAAIVFVATSISYGGIPRSRTG